MKIEIRSLSVNNQDDFFSLFDNDNFSHQLDWKKCYCISYLTTYNAKEWNQRTDSDNREEAVQNIADGKMKGLLAYDGDRCVGWLNVNCTLAFQRLANKLDKKFMNEKTALAICYIVRKESRGKHVASTLLEHAMTFCKELGYDTLISLVYKNDSHVHNFSGPRKMYLDRGFEDYRDANGRLYVVKRL